MTLPRTGLRRVEVNGELFEWAIRKKPTYSQAAFGAPMKLAVELADPEARGTLSVSLHIPRPDNWISPHQTSVTPKVVSEIIVAAKHDGWNPRAGGVYRFDYGLVRDRA